MADTDLAEQLEVIIALAKQAGDAILEVYYKNDLSVSQKQDKTPLTEADMAAHHIIVNGLKKLTPQLPVLSEESAAIPFSERSTWDRYWLVDPLDGTKDFIERTAEFTVNIALIDRHRPILGVVYVPVQDLWYYAAADVGAFKLAADGEPIPLTITAWQNQPIRVVVSRRHGLERMQQRLSVLGDYQLCYASSSLKFCLIAEGSADFYPRYGPTSEWDSGAGQCVVEQAGGQVLDFNFAALRYNTKDSILNPEFFVVSDANLVNYLQQILQSND